MTDFTPCEVVLDYDKDEIRFAGTALPFALSGVQAKAVAKDGRARVTLVLEVDQARSIARIPEPTPPVTWPESQPTPDELFESRLQRARKVNSQ